MEGGKILKIGRNGLPLKRKARLEKIQKIISGQREFSTTRTIWQYRNMLFPDKKNRDNDAFIQFLDRFNSHGTTIIVDIGSGFPTPYNQCRFLSDKNSILLVFTDCYVSVKQLAVKTLHTKKGLENA